MVLSSIAAIFSSPSGIEKMLMFFLLFLVVRGVPAILLYRSVLDGRERTALALPSSAQLPLVIAIAIAALATYFRALVDDLATWSLANTDKPNSSTVAQWIAADVTPTLEEWQKFIVHQDDSWWTKVATSWETYEEWFARLRTLRSLARAYGILLQSGEPVPLPKTIWQRGEEGKGTEATALLGILKIGVFTALTITGGVTMFTIIRDLCRSRKTP